MDHGIRFRRLEACAPGQVCFFTAAEKDGHVRRFCSGISTRTQFPRKFWHLWRVALPCLVLLMKTTVSYLVTEILHKNPCFLLRIGQFFVSIFFFAHFLSPVQTPGQKGLRLSFYMRVAAMRQKQPQGSQRTHSCVQQRLASTLLCGSKCRHQV